ncbi:MAG: DUF2459 domain-containing protein [Gammaproteobacteria bacterium]|nr:DUF2459 domain-containing protein [Gammaproteobacteria bacterium]
MHVAGLFLSFSRSEPAEAGCCEGRDGSRNSWVRSRKTTGVLFLVVVVALLSACLGPVRGLFPADQTEYVKRIYVISHGWHTGIAMRTQDITPATWPRSQDFSDVKYLEVGWGDRGYYQTLEPSSGLTLKAAFLPTRSIIHVVGFDDFTDDYFSGSAIVEIELSEASFERLTGFIRETYEEPDSSTIEIRQGLYPNSRFYPARGRFHLLNTCNTWVARALRAAGCPITPFYAITLGNVMHRSRPLVASLGSANDTATRLCFISRFVGDVVPSSTRKLT